MIRRKDSFGYIDFIRGKYSPYNIDHVQKSVDEMSNHEKERILTEPFDDLWKSLWGINTGAQYRSEEHASGKKFDQIRNGVHVDGDGLVTLADLVSASTTNWPETEWEFPKGRRNFQEKDLDCALREFEEETGIDKTDIVIIENVIPFEEMYVGSNHKCYRHKYFLAFMNNDYGQPLNRFQTAEVSKLEWKSIGQCLESIRPYNLEKKRVIEKVNEVLQQYRIYR
jgi:8-oxo-dGTP pyrophosphatase MutT (NUDIX family)